MFTLAVDGMGGDGAPEVVIQGLSLASRRWPDVRFLVYGPESVLTPLVRLDASLSQKITLHHTDEFITAETKPSVAVRGLKRSSMRLALEAVTKGDAAGVISAGNTGAYLALSKIILKTLPGIDRPAIASPVPTLKGESVMLDLGANIACKAKNLVEFSLMGDIFARHILGIHHPRIGLLNVGSEAGKGLAHLTEAAEMLRNTSLQVHGFIEGDDIAKGTVDVVITDGFTGNVALKTGEGVMNLIFQFLKREFGRSFLTKMAFVVARPVLKKLRHSFDPRRYNGAVWLGLNGIAVKSHGGTDALGFSYAVGVAIDMVACGFNQRIADEIGHLYKDPSA